MDSKPFESIESTQEFVELLLQAIEDAAQEVQGDLDGAEDRRREALLLVDHKLHTLAGHISTSRRILNDLRTLRRLLLEERFATVRKSQVAGA